MTHGWLRRPFSSASFISGSACKSLLSLGCKWTTSENTSVKYWKLTWTYLMYTLCIHYVYYKYIVIPLYIYHYISYICSRCVLQSNDITTKHLWTERQTAALQRPSTAVRSWDASLCRPEPSEPSKLTYEKHITWYNKRNSTRKSYPKIFEENLTRNIR